MAVVLIVFFVSVNYKTELQIVLFESIVFTTVVRK